MRSPIFPVFAAIAATSTLLAATAIPSSSFAAPTSVACAGDLDDLGKFVDALKDVFGIPDAAGRYGALGSIADADVLAKNAAALSPSERSKMAAEMFAVLGDSKLAAASACDQKRVRYNAAALLMQLVENSPAAERAKMFTCLIAATAAEKDPILRRSMEIALDRMKGSVPAAVAKGASPLIDEALPPVPPYDGIFGKDGSKTDIHVTIHAGAETFQTAGYAGVFRKLGATVDHRSPTDWTIHYTVQPDDASRKPIHYSIHMVDQWKDSWDHFNVFRDMDKSSPEIEVYDFHSQYGDALDESLADAPKNKDARKLWILAACKSKVFTSRAQALYPKTHFITTEDGEYFVDTPRMIAQTLKSLANRDNYRQLDRKLAAEDLKNYHFPSDRQQWEYLDTDGDGISDANDTSATCGLKKTAAKDTFDPKEPNADRLALGGEKVLHAVTVANGVMGYNLKVGPRFEDKFVADGWGPADKNGPIATFTKADDAHGKPIWNVKVNAAYSHLSDLALGVALTREMTLFGATNAGKHEATLDEKISAFETGVDLMGAWDPDGTLYDRYQARFGFTKPVPWELANNALDHEDGATAETVKKIREFIER
jgi:hypothetical protein